MQTIPLYDGKMDPVAHVQTYRTWMNIAKADASTLYNAFPLTLSRPAQVWFGRLREGTISSFEQLKKQFIAQFLSSRSQNYGSKYMKTIRQKDDESMREYLERFDEAILQCPMVSQESILSVVQEGLRPSQFLYKISWKMSKTCAELKFKAFSHASTDEDIKGKKGEPS